MSDSGVDSGQDLLNELADEFAQRMRRGERPTIDEYAESHPEFAAEIRNLFPALLLLEQFDPTPSGSHCGSHKRGKRVDTVPDQLGEYRILGRIGRGGMGVVYEAVQESLGRHVALKVLPLSDASDCRLLERFKREAQSAARLHHTNIVPVFGIGEDSGVYYYAMQLIRGQSLDQVLGGKENLETAFAPKLLGESRGEHYRSVAHMGTQVAEALSYAHANGILHRDIKPANLLLDDLNNIWITDFGLARIEGREELTLAEDVIGTLQYVPPERFHGRTDARGDVYSLGLTLYELLTLRSAFASSSRAELVRHILHESPPSPRSVARDIPRDLETIVLKAIAREPERRYQTAEALADDLRRFCADRPIRARRQSLAEQSWRWCRNNPVLAVVGSLAACMLLAVAVVSTLAYVRESNLRDSLQSALHRTREAESRSQNDLYASYVSTAKAAQQRRRQGQRFDSLAAIRKATQLLPKLGLFADEQQEQRDELRDLAIAGLALTDIRELGDLPASGTSADIFHLDRFAQRDASGALIIKRWSDGVELARLPEINEHTWFDFAPESDAILLVDQQAHTLHRWEFPDANPKRIAQLKEHDGRLWHVRFSRDARRILLTHRIGSKGLIEVLDWPSCQICLTRELPFQGGKISAARLSPDGAMVAITKGSYGTEEARQVQVIDVQSGSELATLEHDASVESAAWHPDSKTLAVGLADSNDIVLWNVRERKEVRVLSDQRGGGPLLAMNATGELLSSFSSWGNRLDFWHPYTGKSLLHMSSSLQFEWATDDGRLLGESHLPSGDWHYAIAEPSPVVRTLARNPVYGQVVGWRDVSVHRDGRLLAVGSDHGVSLFDLETGLDVGNLPVGYALHPWFIPGTGDLLTYSNQGLLRWPVTFSEELSSAATIGPPEKLPCPAMVGTQVVSDRSGQVIAAAAGSSAFIIRNDDQRVIELKPLVDCRKIAVSPDGRWVVTASHNDGPLEVWDGDTGASVHRFTARHSETQACFSPDGELLSFERFSPHIVRAGTWQEQFFPDALGIEFNCYSPDGHLAIQHQPGGAALRDAHTGHRLGTFSVPDSPAIWHSTFTPDGLRVILSSNDQHATYVWDLRRLEFELSDLGLGWDAATIMPAAPGAVDNSVSPLQVTVKDGGEQGRAAE